MLMMDDGDGDGDGVNDHSQFRSKESQPVPVPVLINHSASRRSRNEMMITRIKSRWEGKDTLHYTIGMS